MNNLKKEFIVSNSKNILDKYHSSYIEIENQIKEYPLKFLSTRNETVEWGMKLPMFVPVFYLYIFKNNEKIPQQEQFWNFYKEVNNEWFKNKTLSEDLMQGIQARAYRTYPSLVRDIHFGKYLQSKLINDKVIYDVVLDINEGIDLMIISNDKYYAINLYTETSRSLQGRKKKTFRHKQYSNVEYIELPVAFKGSVVVGDFYMYGEREFNQIKTFCKLTS